VRKRAGRKEAQREKSVAKRAEGNSEVPKKENDAEPKRASLLRPRLSRAAGVTLGWSHLTKHSSGEGLNSAGAWKGRYNVYMEAVRVSLRQGGGTLSLKKKKGGREREL